MFAVSFLDNNAQTDHLTGKQVFLRHPVFADHVQWSSLRSQSRSFLQPWEPKWAPNDLGRYAFRERVKHYQRQQRAGTGLAYFIFDQQTGALLGGISLGNIKRGVSQSAQIGYWLGEVHVGKGYMTDALCTVVNHGFTRCGLHRLEAACIPNNVRSIKLLLNAGFQKEGVLKSYLKINGSWHDHALYARINPNSD